MNIANILNGGY